MAVVKQPQNGAVGELEAAPAQQYKFDIDASKLKIPDLKLLGLFEPAAAEETPEQVAERSRALSANLPAIVDMLNRVVIGGVDDVPAFALPHVLKAINAEMVRMAGGAGRGN